jgi:L-lactate dehydrogenase (cytochrome)
MAKLGHPLGEVNLTRAAGKYGIIQMVSELGSGRQQRVANHDLQISSNASCSLEELFEAREPGQPLIFQVR